MFSPLLVNDQLLAQNVPPKATTPGVVQDSAPSPSAAEHGGGGLMNYLPTVFMVAILVPILLLTSRRQKKEHEARASLKKGDRISSNAGLVGELVEMDDRFAKVKIAPGVTVQFLTNSISPLAETDKSPAKDLKEAKAGSDKK